MNMYRHTFHSMIESFPKCPSVKINSIQVIPHNFNVLRSACRFARPQTKVLVCVLNSMLMVMKREISLTANFRFHYANQVLERCQKATRELTFLWVVTQCFSFNELMLEQSLRKRRLTNHM